MTTSQNESVLSLVRRFAAETRGSTAVEYVLIASMISIGIAAMIDAAGQKVLAMFVHVVEIFAS